MQLTLAFFPFLIQQICIDRINYVVIADALLACSYPKCFIVAC